MNKFDNLSIAHLADAYGDVKAQIAALEAREKELKDELLSRGEDEAIGDKWTVRAAPYASKRLDTTAIKRELGEAVARFERETIAIRFTYKPTQIGAEH